MSPREFALLVTSRGDLTPAQRAQILDDADTDPTGTAVALAVAAVAAVAACYLIGDALATHAAMGAACLGNCRQGRDYMCSPMEQRNGGQRIDTDQLLASGALQGPYRTPRPLTLTLRQRVARWVRRHLIDDMPAA